MAKNELKCCWNAEKKSKKFLKDILGIKLFNKFIKEKKIELESGGNKYELYDNGRIINKTTNQSYCIVTTRSDYPIYDIIAIKYSWLKYGQKTVEKVAIKSEISLNRYRNDFGYEAFIHYMDLQGWRRESIILREDTIIEDTNIVTTYSLSKNTHGIIINIRCPTDCVMTTRGIMQSEGLLWII